MAAAPILDRDERSVPLLVVDAAVVAGDDVSQPFDDAVDVVSIVVTTEADTHQSRRRTEVAAAGVGDPTVGVAAAETEEAVDVRLGTEATTADADTVFVTEHGGDQPRVPAVDDE